ncbi:hypothetical protein DGo_PA0012 (plasmid) [Deinococcus gobiensis I-0]|uniref:Uncharacterized protein n=1 Tax=Deinococcus gobiensis (strain DSM 21396 / JCM 16679 / CGMCC 1.7299 / I-0) TaxID=745776 RepID=H8H0M9_DEIGI|nr:hypothetical protein DGo_PA0012 [Deinococcus gobiensis I-0]
MEYFLPVLTGWGALNAALLLVAGLAAFLRRHQPVSVNE